MAVYSFGKPRGVMAHGFRRDSPATNDNATAILWCFHAKRAGA